MSLWYLSFVDDHFLGACVVEAPSMPDACRKAWALNINPGGQVLGVPVPENKEGIFPQNVLMNRATLAEYDSVLSIREADEQGLNWSGS